MTLSRRSGRPGADTGRGPSGAGGANVQARIRRNEAQQGSGEAGTGPPRASPPPPPFPPAPAAAPSPPGVGSVGARVRRVWRSRPMVSLISPRAARWPGVRGQGRPGGCPAPPPGLGRRRRLDVLIRARLVTDRVSCRFAGPFRRPRSSPPPPSGQRRGGLGPSRVVLSTPPSSTRAAAGRPSPCPSPPPRRLNLQASPGFSGKSPPAEADASLGPKVQHGRTRRVCCDAELSVPRPPAAGGPRPTVVEGRSSGSADCISGLFGRFPP